MSGGEGGGSVELLLRSCSRCAAVGRVGRRLRYRRNSMTLLATPTYTALMAGERPWRFTLFIGLVLLAATALGAVLVLNGSSDPGQKLYAAAAASSLSAGVLLMLSWWMSGEFAAIVARRDEWILAVVCTVFIVGGLISSTWWWIVGLPLFGFTKQGWKAARSTLD